MPGSHHLIVDGFNLIHQVSEWKSWLRKEPERARDLLVDWVRPVHDVDGVQTTIVFDGKGRDPTINHPFKDTSFSLVFSPEGVTADTVIERMVGKADDSNSIVVATDDRVHQHTVLSLGAQVMGMKELESWIESCERRMRRFLG